MLSVEKQIAALGRKIDLLEFNSRSVESLESLDKTIVEATANMEAHERGKQDALYIFERDAIRGLIIHDGWKGGQKTAKLNREKRQGEFFKLFDSRKKQNSDLKLSAIIEDSRKAFRESFEDAPGMKTPSLKTVYRWLAAEAQKRPSCTS